MSPKTLAELESTNWLSNNSDALDAELKKQQRLREALLAYVSVFENLLELLLEYCLSNFKKFF